MKISFRNVCGWMMASLLIFLGLVRGAINRAMKGEFILSIYFHKPTKKEFEACIKWLKKNKFTFLSTSDIDNIIRQGLPFPKGAAVLTADDGWESNEFNIVEVANKYQVPVTIFVSTAPVEEGTYWWSYPLQARRNNILCLPVEVLKSLPERERLVEVDKIKKTVFLKREAMTVDQIKRIADSAYITIGAHTHTHPILTNCVNEQVYSEMLVSKNKLEAWTGKQVSYFTYPNGDYGLREMEALKELNYKLAFCSDPRPLTPESLKSTYMLPRFGYLEGASFAENICRIVGIWKPVMFRFKYPFKKKENRGPQPHPHAYTFTGVKKTEALSLGIDDLQK